MYVAWLFFPMSHPTPPPTYCVTLGALTLSIETTILNVYIQLLLAPSVTAYSHIAASGQSQYRVCLWTQESDTMVYESFLFFWNFQYHYEKYLLHTIQLFNF